MVHHQTILHLSTRGRGLIDLTDSIARAVADSRVEVGLCTVFCRHTSCSLLIQENADPSARDDLMDWLERVAPDGDPKYSHVAEGPDDMPSHLRAAITSTSENIPITDGKLGLGTWQGVFLVEHRLQGHERSVIVHVAGD